MEAEHISLRNWVPLSETQLNIVRDFASMDPQRVDAILQKMQDPDQIASVRLVGLMFPFLFDVERFLCFNQVLKTSELPGDYWKTMKCTLREKEAILAESSGQCLFGAQVIHFRHEEIRTVLEALHQEKLTRMALYKCCSQLAQAHMLAWNRLYDSVQLPSQLNMSKQEEAKDLLKSEG
jgi:hypothetical protein